MERKREEGRGGREGEREGRREGRREGEGGRERREERRERGREGGIEGGTFIHTPTYIVHMHTLICTLTAVASWQVRTCISLPCYS